MCDSTLTSAVVSLEEVCFSYQVCAPSEGVFFKGLLTGREPTMSPDPLVALLPDSVLGKIA